MIPRSQGVTVGKTTETGLAPKSIAQTQIIPNALANLGGTISSIGINKLQQEQAEQRKAQEEFQATQALDFRNKLREFDNQAKIRLSESANDPEIINGAKEKISEERKNYFEELSASYGDDKRLQKVLQQEYETSQVSLDFSVDKELSNKRKTYAKNALYSTVFDLENRFNNAKREEDLIQVSQDLSDTLNLGLKQNLVSVKEINSIENRIRESRKRKEKVQADLLEKAQKLRFSDPWKFVDTFDKEDVPEIDLVNVENSAESLEKRIEFVSKKSEQYQIDMPLLNKNESEALIKTLESATPENATGYLNSLTSNITEEQKDLLAKNIFEENKSLGLAITLANEDGKTSSEILSGSKAIKSKVVTMPSPNTMRNKFLDIAGDAIVQQDYREASIEAITNIYAHKAVSNNINDTNTDQELIEKSIKQVFGDIIEVNDSKVVGFRKNDGKFISESEFEDLFDGLDRATIMSVQGDVPRIANGSELSEDALKDAQLVVVGDGLYTISLYDEFAVDKQGNPFVLNLKEIYNR